MTRLDETFIIFNFDELWTRFSSDTTGLLCLSDRDRSVLLDLLRIPGWASRWIGNDNGGDAGEYPASLLRNNGRDADLATALDYVEDLKARIIMASCLEELASAITGQGAAIQAGLEAIAAAIPGISLSQTQTQSCGGVTVTVPVNNYLQGSVGGTPIYGGTPTTHGVDTEGQVPPEGFDTWEDYLTYKCRAANFVFDAIVSSIHGLAALDIALLIESGAAGGLIASALFAGALVPEIAIPALIAALVAIVGLGLGLGDLDDVGTHFDTNRDDIVCEFYRSSSVQEAVEVVSSVVDEAIAALAIGTATGALIRTIALIIATTDTIDQLFKLSLIGNYPDADCSGCDVNGEAPRARYFNADQSEMIALDVTEDANGWKFTLPAPLDNAYDPDGVLLIIDFDLLGHNVEIYDADFTGFEAMSGRTSRLLYANAAWTTGNPLNTTSAQLLAENIEAAGAFWGCLIYSATGEYTVHLKTTPIA